MNGVKQSEREILDVLLKAVPGGLLAAYAEDDFPVCFVNERYLDLLGYESYEEYVTDVDGLAINSIHPEDRDKVVNLINSSCQEDNQYGIEYRIRTKYGDYIYVHDEGKKVTSIEGNDILVSILIDITEHVKEQKILAKESASDELTQIFNRRGGIRLIEKHLKTGDPYTLAIFDIDNLKLINDEYNHKAGDTALVHFVELMVAIFDTRTIFSRFGGDEFIAFIPQRLDKDFLARVLRELQEEYCSFIDENYPKSYSSVSIGCVEGNEQTTFDELYQEADALMYRIKKGGKNGCLVKEL